MKKYLLFLFFSAMLNNAFAQISIQPVLPLAGIIQKNNLWNIAVINTSSATFDCRLELVLRDRVSGLEVLTATTGQFLIGAGAKQLNASQLTPLQYNYISQSASGRADDFVPIGDYTACYRLTTGKNIIAEECISFDVEPLSPPILITPADSSVLQTQPSQFTWIPPAPMNLFSRLSYEVMVTEILPGQKAEEAMQQNLTFYTEPNIPVNNLTYRGMGSSFEKDKWYAWQVVARDDKSYAGKSEVWVFKIDSTKKQNEPAEGYSEVKPFYTAKKYYFTNSIRFSFNNPYEIKNLEYSIKSVSTNKVISKLPKVAMNKGLNKIAIHTSDFKGIKRNEEYILEIHNLGNANYFINFIIVE